MTAVTDYLIARMAMIEHDLQERVEEKTRNLEKQQRILKKKNEALLRLTEECHEKRENLRTVFRAITARIIVIDREYNIMMSNKDEIGDSGKCYAKLFGLSEPCRNCTAHETFESLRDITSERENDEKYYRLSTHPISGVSKSIDRVMEVCRDITDEKRMEAQLIQSYKLASLGKLVAGVAHEINNPNTFILGNLKIVQEAFTDIFPILDEYHAKNSGLRIARLDYNVFKENISVLVNDMINGAERTKKIVGDLRNFAKKDAGELTDEVDLNEVVRNNISITRKHVNKVAVLETDLDENLPRFRGNIQRLEQVVINLIMNASEAIEGPEGRIRIKTFYNETTKEAVLIVSDNGTGMDETTLKSIFDPFFTTKRNKGGTGLGLSITYGIINDHQGKIDVTSKPGTGTTFTIRFPVK
ncbi:MAG: ATP-binding protein [Syntrophothermus sp.]